MEEFKTKDGQILSVKKEIVNLNWKKYYRILAVSADGTAVAHITYSTQCNNACIHSASLDNKQFAGQGIEKCTYKLF